jgi:hypothetical protein
MLWRLRANAREREIALDLSVDPQYFVQNAMHYEDWLDRNIGKENWQILRQRDLDPSVQSEYAAGQVYLVFARPGDAMRFRTACL